MDEHLKTSAGRGVGEIGVQTDVRVFSLGRFGVGSQRRPNQSGSKGQLRPSALLKFLVARGGHDVSCSLISETLWPDADGDLGAGSLTVTLHRLRQMLGKNAAIICHDGKLSFNEQVCWLDVWEFERLVNDALHCAPLARSKNWETSLRSALKLYRGHFLALEEEQAWMLEPRARWRIKFERATIALSSFLEDSGRLEEAMDLCLQSLELDPFNEALYRRVMSCYLKRGEAAAVARTYENCREVLGKGLGASPSAETERMYRAAMGQSHLPAHGGVMRLSVAAGAMR